MRTRRLAGEAHDLISYCHFSVLLVGVHLFREMAVTASPVTASLGVTGISQAPLHSISCHSISFVVCHASASPHIPQTERARARVRVWRVVVPELVAVK